MNKDQIKLLEAATQLRGFVPLTELHKANEEIERLTTALRDIASGKHCCACSCSCHYVAAKAISEGNNEKA